MINLKIEGKKNKAREATRYVVRNSEITEFTYIFALSIANNRMIK